MREPPLNKSIWNSTTGRPPLGARSNENGSKGAGSKEAKSAGNSEYEGYGEYGEYEGYAEYAKSAGNLLQDPVWQYGYIVGVQHEHRIKTRVEVIVE
jgi:hypothetical protein